MKQGDKIVCIFDFKSDKDAGYCILQGLPKEREIYIHDGINDIASKKHGYDFIFIVGIGDTLGDNRACFRSALFRPITDIGEKIAEEIEKEMVKEFELVEV